MARITPISNELSLYSDKQAAESLLFTKPLKMYSRNIKAYIEPLMKVVPRSCAYEVAQLSVQDFANACEAKFTWRYNGSNPYCTRYWGDGIYYISGQLEDGTWIQCSFDDHNWDVEEDDDIGDIMCQAFLKLVTKEEKYHHSLAGDIHRLHRRIEKWTKNELLEERRQLIIERRRCLERKAAATTKLGIELWERMLGYAEDKLSNNAQCIWLKNNSGFSK